MIYVLMLFIGLAAGLCTLTPLAALSVGAWLGWIDLSATWAGFLGNIIAVVILVIAALAELFRDQMPGTGKRTDTPAVYVRFVSGAIAGALLGLPSGNWIAGIVVGALGAVIGSYGGYQARARLAAAFHADLPAALLEDVLTIVLALAVVYRASGAFA